MMNIYKMIKHLLLFSEYYLHAKKRNSKIFCYHDLYDLPNRPAFTYMATSFQLFKKHIEIIKNNKFEIVSRITKKENQIMIVFDDGWEGLYYFKDFFIQNEIFPTICIAATLIGKAGYLNKEQLKELIQAGFQIQCHSWLHQTMTLYNNTEDSIRRELKESRDYIESLLNIKIDVFCYPQGFFSKKIYEKTLEYNYNEIWTCVDGDYYDEILPKLKRRCLVQFASPNELKWIIFGTNRFLGKKHLKLGLKNF